MGRVARGRAPRRLGEPRHATGAAARRAAAVEAEESTRQAASIQTLTTALSSAVTPSDVANELVERTPLLIGARGGALALIEGDEIVIVGPSGLARQTHTPGLRLPLATRAPIARAAAEGEVKRANDRASFERDFPDGATLSPFARAALAVPLKIEGVVVGSLSFLYDDPSAVHEEADAIAAIAADLGGQALERARLYARERQWRQALDRILRAAPRLYSGTTDEVSLEICREARRALGADITEIWRVDADWVWLELVCRVPEEEPLSPEERLSIADLPGLRDAVEKTQVTFVPDAEAALTGDLLEYVRRIGIRSWLWAPIAAGGRTERRPLLLLGNRATEPDPSLMLLARRFSDHAGLALEQLERREAEDEAQRRALETRRLLDSTAALAAAATPSEVTNAILTEGLRSLGAASGVVVTVTADGDALEIIDSHGYRPETLAPWTTFPLDAEVPLARAARDNTVVAVESPRTSRCAFPRSRPVDRSDRLLALAAPERGRIGAGRGRLLVLDAACLPGGGARVRRRARATVEPRARAGDTACRGIRGADACRGARRAGERPERGGEPGGRHSRGARAAHGSRDGGRGRVVRARERRRARARRAGGERARLRRGPEPAGVERELASGRERPRATAGVDRDGGRTGRRTTTPQSWHGAGIAGLGAVPLFADRRLVGVLVVGFGSSGEVADEVARRRRDRRRPRGTDARARVAHGAGAGRQGRRGDGIAANATVAVDHPGARGSGQRAGRSPRSSRARRSQRSRVTWPSSSPSTRRARRPEVLASLGAEEQDVLELTAPVTDAALRGTLVIADSEPSTDLAANEVRAAAARVGLQGAISVPLGVGSRVLGAVFVGFRGRAQVGVEDSALLQTLARIGAQAFERSRLFDDEQRLRRRTDRVQLTTAALSGSLTQRDVAEVVVDALVQGAGADAAALSVVMEDRAVQKKLAWRGYEPEAQETWLEIPLDAPTPGNHALSTRSVVFYERFDELARDFPEAAHRMLVTGHESFLFLPLVAGGRTNGLVVTSFAEPVSLDDEDRAFMETLASQAAQALDRARSFESERTIAETLQRSVLPASLPKIANVQLAARYLPGTDEVDVGGDWFDAISSPPAGWGSPWATSSARASSPRPRWPSSATHCARSRSTR